MEGTVYAFEYCDVADERGGVPAVGGARLSVLEEGPASPLSGDAVLFASAGRLHAGAFWVCSIVQAQPWYAQDVFFPMYFYRYWAVYIASAVALFFICIEVFRSRALGLLRPDAAWAPWSSAGRPWLR